MSKKSFLKAKGWMLIKIIAMVFISNVCAKGVRSRSASPGDNSLPSAGWVGSCESNEPDRSPGSALEVPYRPPKVRAKLKFSFAAL
jgi:hypothetical protein